MYGVSPGTNLASLSLASFSTTGNFCLEIDNRETVFALH